MPPSADSSTAAPATPAPLIPPLEAYLRGWMPLRATGVEAFLRDHPEYDGRGVLIAILDSGIDPGVAGLGTTSTGEKKILDLRDFSGEGRVALSPVTLIGESVRAGGRAGAGVACSASGTPDAESSHSANVGRARSASGPGSRAPRWTGSPRGTTSSRTGTPARW